MHGQKSDRACAVTCCMAEPGRTVRHLALICCWCLRSQQLQVQHWERPRPGV